MSLVPIPIGGSVPNLFHFRDSFACIDFVLVFVFFFGEKTNQNGEKKKLLFVRLTV